MLDKNKSLKHECGCGCVECTCGRRNRFFRGKRMKADDFEIEQRYSIERRRIINQSVIGSGVVSGFDMQGGPSVGPGFALDEYGREIVLAHRAALGRDNLVLVAHDGGGCRILPLDQVDPEKRYLLSIHYAERPYGDADIHGGCGCEKPEKNYVCETGVFSLTEICEPGCPCGEQPCDWECDCRRSWDSCDEQHPSEGHTHTPEQSPGRLPHEASNATIDEAERNRAIEEAIERLREDGELPPPELFDRKPHRPYPSVRHTRGGRGPHACLCHRVTAREIECTPPHLCHWRGYFIDPTHGVALACVTITKKNDECDPIDIVVGEVCGPRHFVKTNDLLYDFIRGCDLTHISWVSWYWWHRRYELMPWRYFASLFYSNAQNPGDPNNGRTQFVVRFSAPVFIDTIRYDSVQMRAITIEQATDWRLIRRIPIVRFDYTPHTGGLMPNTTDQIRIIVSSDWVDDEIHGKSSWLSGNGFEVEFELDGFGLLDCHRQPIDAEAIGLEAFPTGNGSPGGIYRSAFRVHAKPHRPGYAA